MGKHLDNTDTSGEHQRENLQHMIQKVKKQRNDLVELEHRVRDRTELLPVKGSSRDVNDVERAAERRSLYPGAEKQDSDDDNGSHK